VSLLGQHVAWRTAKPPSRNASQNLDPLRKLQSASLDAAMSEGTDRRFGIPRMSEAVRDLLDAELLEVGRPRLLDKTRMRFDKVRQRYVLLLPERAVLLSETAAEILQLCDGTQTVAGLIGVLQSKYPGAELRADVVEFLGQAVQKGWVEWILPP